MILTGKEFRHLRDTTALDSYRQRWSVLQRKELALRAEIARIETTETPRAVDDAKRDKGGPWYQLQDVTSELLWIERDAKVRIENLERES